MGPRQKDRRDLLLRCIACMACNAADGITGITMQRDRVRIMSKLVTHSTACQFGESLCSCRVSGPRSRTGIDPERMCLLLTLYWYHEALQEFAGEHILTLTL